MVTKLITLFTYALIASSMLSCCSRADYNILIGFFILLRRGYTSNDKVKTLTKLSIHFLAISLLLDIFWIFRFTGIWTHGNETSELWQSLSSIHNLVYFLGILEFLLKMPIIFIIYKEFVGTLLGGQRAELFNLRYVETKN